MPGHDVIVMGASAGGVEALKEVVRGLPKDLPAAVFVVVHFPTNYSSILPSILSRHGALPASHARDGEKIENGRIYVAPPDYHMLLHRGCVRLTHGPRENANRPAVDPLFRSAALAYGPRVVGVILSGNLDDGTSGIAQIKSEGGLAIVQDPEEAMCSGMPSSAIENATIDRVLPLKEIAAALVRFAHDEVNEPQKREVDERVLKEAEMAEVDPDVVQLNDRPGTPSGFTCPECGGGLWETQDGKLAHFRCRTGHAYSIKTLLTEQSNAVESALWSAMAALKEKSSLARRMAEQARNRGQAGMALRFDKQADEADRDTELVRKVVLSFKDQATNGDERNKRLQRTMHPGHGEEDDRSAQCPPLPESVRGDRDPAEPNRR